jgi:Xaa-Pro aminopeptidase
VRRAHVAAERALDVARRTATPGTPVATVRREAVAELTAFGFEDASARVHGVGVAERERPTAGRIPADATLALAVGVSGEEGAVRLGDTVHVGDESGATPLADLPTALSG